jgi:hypothetical protein
MPRISIEERLRLTLGVSGAGGRAFALENRRAPT